MAAQARSYNKGISYSSRQVDDKYIQKNHRSNHIHSDNGSSPYRNKSYNYAPSPNGRKRAYDSPSSSSSKHSNSPYENCRKKERLSNNSMNKSKEIKSDGDWSQHVSSTGKIYYYNKKTEDSQWEVPKEWLLRQGKESQRNNHFAKEKRENDNKSSKISPSTYRDYGDHERYRESRRGDNRDMSYNNSRGERDRDYHEMKDYSEEKYRTGSSKRGLKYSYNSPNIKSVGQSTPQSVTSLSRSYCGTPDMNGSDTVQDISPPGTPTNDDVMNISNISPAPLYTPQGCSPLLNSSLSNSVIQLPHTPILSPIVINSTGQLPTQYLHPLQQALLIQQQQASLNITGSPKLPTVKNHFSDTGSASSSPKLSSSFQFKNQNSPAQSFRSSNSSTPPPPPPPPPKDHHTPDTRERTSKIDRYNRNNSLYEPRIDNISRSKSYDRSERNNETMKTNHKSSELRSNNDRLLLQKSNETKTTTERVKHPQKTCNDFQFTELPSLEKYSLTYSPGIPDFTAGFYGSMLEKQVSGIWEETMGFLLSDGCYTKTNLLAAKREHDVLETKLDVVSNWYDALNTVLEKVESLQDSSMQSDFRNARDHKASPIPRKSKSDSCNSAINEPKENGCIGTDNVDEDPSDNRDTVVQVVTS